MSDTIQGMLDFERVLRIANQPLTIDRRRHLHLKTGNVDGFPDDIEQCVVITDP
jgi:hypothetical protein